jgi:hypothetical protein
MTIDEATIAQRTDSFRDDTKHETSPSESVHTHEGNGIDEVGVEAGSEVGETSFMRAKIAMGPYLNHYRMGHADWDHASVLAQAGFVEAEHRRVKPPFGKGLLVRWVTERLRHEKVLRDQTTRPIPEPKPEQPPGRRSKDKPGEDAAGEEHDPLAAWNRATTQLQTFIDQFEAGDIARQAVLAAVPDIAARHGVLRSTLSGWTRDELKKLEPASDNPSDGSKDEPDPAAVPEDPAERQRLLDAAWALCQDIARSPIQQLLGIARRLGVVGDYGGTITVFLILTSRLLAEPASLQRKGASSSGKSYPIENLIWLFNKDVDFIEMTAVSAKALPYDQRSYRHRAIIIGEATVLAAGKQGDEAFLSMVRELISKGKIVYTTVVTRKNAMPVSLTIEKEGPITLLTTTARELVEEEMGTRLLVGLADETQQQTRTVVIAQGLKLKGVAPPFPAEAELAAWQAFQHWLRLGPCEVVVPFADVLSNLVDVRPLRIRRDFPAVGALIQASALINRAQRKRDAQGRIIATLADYGIVLHALNAGLDEMRYGNVEQLNQVRDVVVDRLERRQRAWWREETLRRTVNALAQHAGQNNLPGLEQRVRDAGAAAAAGQGRDAFARFRAILTNAGQDPTWGGAAATGPAAEQRVRSMCRTAGRAVRTEIHHPAGLDQVPRTIEISYARLAEALGITFKVARIRMTMAIEAGAIIMHEPIGRARTAPHLLSPGQVVIPIREVKGQGAFPSRAEVEKNM